MLCSRDKQSSRVCHVLLLLAMTILALALLLPCLALPCLALDPALIGRSVGSARSQAGQRVTKWLIPSMYGVRMGAEEDKIEASTIDSS